MRVNEPITDREIELPDGQPLVSRTDTGGRIVFANRAFIDISGFTEAELIGQPHSIVRHPHMPKEAFGNLWSTIKAGRPWEGLVKNRAKNGDFYWVRANVTPVVENGSVTGFISIRSKPTRQQVAEAETGYGRLRRGDPNGIGLHDGQLVARGLIPSARNLMASVTGRLGLTMLLAILSLVLTSLAARTTDGWTASGAALAGGVAIVAASLSVLRAVNRPLVGIAQAFDTIARNNWNADIPAPAAREYWGIVRQLRAMRATLNFAMHEHTEAERRASVERRDAILAMAHTVETEANASMARIVEATGAMAKQAEDMAHIAESVSGNAGSVSQAAAAALANAQAVGAASEELSASIQEISSQVARASEIAQRAVRSGEEAQSRIHSLSEAAIRIGDVVRLIHAIAEQTNLLALNATIEAARAGEAGRGFTVVASEVKGLAGQTARSTEEISRQIGAIQDATKSAVAVVEDLGKAIGEIAQVSSGIAAAVEQQASATQEIARNVMESSTAAQSVSDKIADVSRDAEVTGSQATTLKAGSAAVADTIASFRSSIIRTIRTATEESDRRETTRWPFDSGCSVTIDGRHYAGRVADISIMGARISGPTGVVAGQRGTLTLDRADASARFRVAAVHPDGALGVAFEDGGVSAGLQAILERGSATSTKRVA